MVWLSSLLLAVTTTAMRSTGIMSSAGALVVIIVTVSWLTAVPGVNAACAYIGSK